MKHIISVLSAALLAAVGALAGETTLVEHVLPNLCSGPPADPLPPVRANHPSAAEMAARPRQHPYLFFDAASLQALRDRAQAEPFHSLMERLRAHAEDCLKRPIPSLAKAVEGIKQYLPDGSLNPEFLRNNYDDLYEQSGVVMEVIPTLGFAYQLTGDRRYGDAGKQWLLNYAARPILAKKERAADFGAADVMFGLSIGYDWLWELLSEPERALVQHKLAEMAGPMMTAARKYLGNPHPERIRGDLGNNHPVRTHGLFGITTLVLLNELPEAQEWLDLEIQLNRDRLLPSTWAPNGEYIDAWDHFESVLDDPIPFLVALQHMGGEDLFNDPRLAERFRGISRYWLYGLERSGGLSSWYGWLALAGHLKDPVAQWIAARDLKLKSVNEIFGYLFYDPTVPAVPPVDPAGGVYWAYSGMVKLCSDWSPRGILIPFRCGPEIGKDNGDQNGFHLRAGGDWLVPRLQVPKRKPEQPAEFQWDLYAWFWGSPAQSIVIPEPEGIADSTTYERTGRIPLNGGIQFAEFPAMKGRQYEKQWLSGPDIPKNGELRVVSLDPALDYVCGEAHRAYLNDPPSSWIRHLLFVKSQKTGRSPYIVICDEVRAGDRPVTFAWQLHSQYPFSLRSNGFDISGRVAGLDVHLLEPANGRLVEKQTPAPLEKQRTSFVQWQTPGPESRCNYLTALVPRVTKEETVPLSFRVVKATGGWAVEVRDGTATDLVLFRAERAQSVAVGDVSVTGTAALFRNSDDLPATLYVMGKP